jgi:hypothetical protein
MFAAITLIEYKVLKGTKDQFTDYQPTPSDVLMAIALSLCPVLNTVVVFMLLSTLAEQLVSVWRLRQ